MRENEETEIAVESSVLGVCFSFDVECSMFDVRRSSFKTAPYGINAIRKHLQNNLALMGPALVKPGFAGILLRRIVSQGKPLDPDPKRAGGELQLIGIRISPLSG